MSIALLVSESARARSLFLIHVLVNSYLKVYTRMCSVNQLDWYALRVLVNGLVNGDAGIEIESDVSRQALPSIFSKWHRTS